MVTTLGTDRDAQIIDNISGEHRDRFMLHYNFPPFSTGEISFLSSPKRREIGHGRLARRSISAVLPDMAKFPYVVRVVSEITESNGSSSMASVCGASLSLMDAGVPTSAPVAGVAMGLVKEGSRYQVLTDILGDEDHLGDMDFKVAGTAQGVTALQMDIKIDGITRDIMGDALKQAREARLHILQPDESGAGCPAPEDVRLGADHHHGEDRSGKNPGCHRQGWLGDPRDHRGDRYDHRHRKRWHGENRVRGCGVGPGGSAAGRTDHGRRGGWPYLRGSCRKTHGLRRLCHDSAGPGRARAHLTDLRRAGRDG